MGMLLAPQLLRAIKAYGIKCAARFDGLTGYMSQTFGTPESDLKKFTLSCFVARTKFTGFGASDLLDPVLTAGIGSGQYSAIGLTGSGAYDDAKPFFAQDGFYKYTGSGVLRDVAFYHLHVVGDSTAGAGARLTFTISGETWTTTVGSEIALNDVFEFGNNVEHRIGNHITLPTQGFGHTILAELHFIPGLSVASTEFAEFDLGTGNWKATKYTGSHGSNGSYLDFSKYNGGVPSLGNDLGYDASGNGNHWTVNGTIEQVTSTPTRRYAALSPLNKSMALSNGNRTWTDNGSFAGAGAQVVTDLLLTTGKYSAEVHVDNVGSTAVLGVGFIKANINCMNAADYFALPGSILYVPSGNKKVDGVLSAYGSPFTTNDTVTAMINFVDNTVTFKVNNVSQGAISWTPPSGGVVLSLYQVDTLGAAATVRIADDEFSYPLDAGYKSMCTNNLPKITDSIDNHFKTVLYTGNGGTNAVTGVGFQPDFVWAKPRSLAQSHAVFDGIRGATKRLVTDLSIAETTLTDSLTSFDVVGFTLGSGLDINTIGATYVAWCASLPKTASAWGFGETITPTGEIYNDSAMFKISIVTVTMDGSSAVRSIPHSLQGIPGFIVGKDLDAASSHFVYHSSVGSSSYLELNTAAAAAPSANVWGGTDPTNQLFYVGSSMTSLTHRWVFYIFAPCDGIKLGSYTGNSSLDGPLINEGISPVWGLFKPDTLADWTIFDDVRATNNPAIGKAMLNPNLPDAEHDAVADLDFLHAGVKVRNINTDTNFSGRITYMLIGQPNGPTENPAR